MALQMRVVYEGVNMPTAYIKITHMRGDKDNMQAKISYSNSPTEGQIFEEHYNIPMDLGDDVTTFGKNPVRQGYEHIKTFDGSVPGRRNFSNAIDV